MSNGINWRTYLAAATKTYGNAFTVDAMGNRTPVTGVLVALPTNYEESVRQSTVEANDACMKAMGAVPVEIANDDVYTQQYAFLGFAQATWAADFAAFLTAYAFSTPGKPRALMQYAFGTLVQVNDASKVFTVPSGVANPALADLPVNPFA